MVLVMAVVMAMPAQADPSCNFEDGLLCGWLPATTGGSGSTGVEAHNGSQMAFVQHAGVLTHSLSQDFNYAANDFLSFTMHAVANAGANGTHAASGVRVSFLNAFNVPLGSAGLYNVSSMTWLGAHDAFVDNVQHDYSATLASFAVLAGLAPTDPIARVSVSFAASGQTDFFGNVSTAIVWFDNVNVGVVPEPTERALLLAGLAMAGLLARRRRATLTN